MKFSTHINTWIAAVFAIICYGVALTGFSSVGDMTDPAQMTDARGFACFWAFLGTVAVALSAASMWINEWHNPAGSHDHG